MADQRIPYAEWVQRALMEVVRWALERASRREHGDHHFFISFDTRYPGVELPSELREKYPETMTIQIRQHFRELTVHPDRFEIVLSFSGEWTRVVVPFDSIERFLDQSEPAPGWIPPQGTEIEPPPFQLVFQVTRPAGEASSAETQLDGEASGDVVSLDAFRKKNT